jgi:hypothetical protein
MQNIFKQIYKNEFISKLKMNSYILYLQTWAEKERKLQ